MVRPTTAILSPASIIRSMCTCESFCDGGQELFDAIVAGVMAAPRKFDRLNDFYVWRHQHEDGADVAPQLGDVEFFNFFEVAFHGEVSVRNFNTSGFASAGAFAFGKIVAEFGSGFLSFSIEAFDDVGMFF